jgi:hypothetical protein
MLPVYETTVSFFIDLVKLSLPKYSHRRGITIVAEALGV